MTPLGGAEISTAAKQSVASVRDVKCWPHGPDNSYGNDVVTVDLLGDDSNIGSSLRPVRSVERAIALLGSDGRRAIQVRNGVYHIAHPLVLTAAMDGAMIAGSCDGGTTILDGMGDAPLLTLRGTRGVVLSGLTFAGNYPVGLMLDGATDCVVENNAVLRSGTAILLDHASGNRIERNLVLDPAASGIELRDGSDANLIADNDIEGAGASETQGGGIFLHGVQANRIAHNLIQDTAGMGIGIANWDPATINIANIVEYNVLRDTALAAFDSGAIYVLGRSGVDTQTVIAGNVVDGVGPPGRDGALAPLAAPLAVPLAVPTTASRHNVGIYLDDSTNGALVTRNLVRRAGSDAVQIHGGSDNRVENNVLDLGPARPSAVLFQAAPADTNPLGAQTGNVVARNIILSANADPKLFVWIDGGTPSISGNLYANATGTAPAWVPPLADSAPVIADPLLGLGDADTGYTAVQRAAQTLIGFRPFDPASAGPRRLLSPELPASAR